MVPVYLVYYSGAQGIVIHGIYTQYVDARAEINNSPLRLKIANINLNETRVITLP